MIFISNDEIPELKFLVDFNLKVISSQNDKILCQEKNMITSRELNISFSKPNTELREKYKDFKKDIHRPNLNL